MSLHDNNLNIYKAYNMQSIGIDIDIDIYLFFVKIFYI